MPENLTPEQAQAEIDALTAPGSAYRSPKTPSWETQRIGERLVELRRIVIGNENHPILEIDGTHVQTARDPSEQAPVPLPEPFTPLQLPPSVSASHPAIREAQEIAHFAQMAAGGLQGAIAAAVRALREHPPASQADVDAAEGRMLELARKKYGPVVHEWGENLEAGEAILGRYPALREFLADPRTWNTFELQDTIAQLGARSRQYHVRKHGTRTIARIP